METKVVKKTKNDILIEWSKEGVGFGQLEMHWDTKLGRFVLDSEYMGIDHVIEVLKAVEV